MTRFIGQAHSLLHGSGVVRIQTHISIGTRTDKKQGFQDKVDAVNAILEGMPRDGMQHDDDDTLDDTDGPSMHDLDHSMADGDPNIQPGLEQHRIGSNAYAPQANMGSLGHDIHQQLLASNHMSTAQQMQHHLHPQSSHHMSHSPHPLSQHMNL